MSQGSQQVVAKLNEILSVNRMMEQHLAKGGKGGKEKEGDEKKKGGTKKEDIEAMASLSTSMATLVTALKDSKKIDPKKGEAMGEFVLNFATKIKTVIKQLDKEALKEFTNLVAVMQNGVAGFIFKMAAVAILTPVAMVGAAGFGVMVLILMKIFSKAAKVERDTIDGIASIVNMSKGMAILVLVLVAMALMAPQVAKGFLVFSLVVMGIAILLRIVDLIAGGGLNPLSKGPLGSLMRLAKGMALFTLTLILMSVTAPLIAMGFLVFALVILGIAIVLRIVDMIAGGGFNPMSKGPLGSLSKLGVGLALFALTLVLITFVKEQFIIGALMIMLAIVAFGAVIWGLSKMLNKGGVASLSPKAKGPLPDLLKMSKALFIFALTAVAVGFFVSEFAKGALALILSLGALAIVMIPYGAAYMRRASKNLLKVSLSLGAFALVIGAFSWMAEKSNLTWTKLAMLGAAVAGAALVGTLLGMGPAAAAAPVGAKSLLTISYAIGIFAAAIGAWSWMAEKSKMSGAKGWERLGMLGAAIGVAALVGTLLGTPMIAPWITIGAPLLLTVSYAFGIFAAGLAVFAHEAKNMSWQTLAMLSAAITTVALVGTLLGNPWTAAFTAIGAGLLILLSVALLPFSYALSIFAKTKWTKPMTESLSYALESIAGAFANLAKGDNWYYASLGIFGMRDVGNTLISLAGGIQAMANMTFTEYVWDEATKKLQPKKKVKLTREDVSLAADNAAYTISALSLPLAMFGMLFSGGAFGAPNNPFTKMGITPFGIMMGINSLASLGTGLSKLAGGVVDWANMGYWEYGLVYNPQTKMNELKPIKRAKITPTDISAATTNISDVLAAMIKPIAQLGALMAGGQAVGMMTGGLAGLFGGGKNPVEQGIKSIASIGTGIGSLASGVRDWATMSYWEYGLQMNPKTKMYELTKIGQKKVSKTEIKEATANIGRVLEAMLLPIAGLGAAMSGGAAVGYLTGGLAGLFGQAKNPVEQGINAISSIGKGIASLATGVAGFAKMEIIEQIIQKDPKTGLNVLVPGKVSKLSPTMVTAATDNIAKILSAGIIAVARFAWQVHLQGGDEKINKSIATASNMSKSLGEVYTNVSKTFGDQKKGEAAITNWKSFVTGLFNGSDGIFNFKYKIFKQGGDDKFESALEQAGELVNKMSGISYKLNMYFKDGSKLNKTLTNWNIFFTRLFRPFSVLSLKHFAQFGGMFAKHISQVGMLSTKFKAMDTTLKPQLLWKYKSFTETTQKLAKIADPFTKFVKSFGDLAKHMGVFATNFKVMDVQGIMAFKDWTGSITELSKADISKGSSILDFAKGAVDHAFKMGGELLGGKSPTDYTESDKKTQVKAQTTKTTAKTETKGKGQETQAQHGKADIDYNKLAQAISSALQNITVDTISARVIKDRS